MPIEFAGSGMNPQGQQNARRLKQLESEEEERRRRALLDAELGDIRQRVSPEQYEELLSRQRNYTDIGKVDKTLKWHQIQKAAGEKGTEQAIEQAKEMLGPEGQKYLNSVRPRYGPANEEERNDILNSPEYQRVNKKFNEQAGQAQGREFEHVDRVAGFEDRPTTYAEGLASAVKKGVYEQDFDDHAFDDDVFKRRWADSRKMDKWQLDSHSRALKEQLDGFEKTRQKLTENYQRMDPFGRTQYKEMEKKAKGLEKARQEGRLRPLEYLRHMATLSDTAKTIKWKHHMKSPGGEVGDIWDKDGNGAMYQRQSDGSVQMVGMTPEYFQSKVHKLDEGLWLIPTIDKDGREVMKEVKGGRPGVDWKEKQEYNKELKDLTKEYKEEWLSQNDDGSGDPKKLMEDAYDWAQQRAIQELSARAKIAEQLSNPDKEDPDADPEAFMQEKAEAESKAAFEKGQLDAKQSGLQRLAQQRVERRKIAEAVAPVQEVIHNRRKSFGLVVESMQQEQYEKALDQWVQENQETMEWMDRTAAGEELGPPPPYKTPMPEKPDKLPANPEKVLKGTYKELIDQAETPEEFRHFFSTAATDNPAMKHLLDNPIPVKSDAMKRGKYLRDGYVYSRYNNEGVEELFLKHKGKWFPLGSADLNNPNPIAEDNGMFGNMIDHGNEPANMAAQGNL